MYFNYLKFTIFLISCLSFAQNNIDINAKLDVKNKQLFIIEKIQYQNTSTDTLHEIYLNNWANAYATKTSPLAKRLADDYRTELHFAKANERGFSNIESITSDSLNLKFYNVKNHIDVLKVILNKPLLPNTSYNITIKYFVQVANTKFTGFGVTKNGDYYLKYWYITPAVYNGKWQWYSEKNLNDMYAPFYQLNLAIEIPSNYTVASGLNLINSTTKNATTAYHFQGENVNSSVFCITQEQQFNTLKTSGFNLVTDVDYDTINDPDKLAVLDSVTKYITSKFGAYPHKNLLVSKIDAEINPIYGLNFLPGFIKVYPKTFEFELKMLKVILHNYLENTLLINPREDQWIIDGIESFYLMDYVEHYYPNMKFLGSAAKIWGVKASQAAKLKYNDKYATAYMLMARTNIDQPLHMAKDSLLKFNYNIANKYKAGVGLIYLDDYLNDVNLSQALQEFVIQNKLKPIDTDTLKSFLQSKTNKDINWFFEDYINSNKKIDYAIKRVKKTTDSITVTIKNKRHNNMPMALYQLKNDSIISKQWLPKIKDTLSLTLANNDANKLALNYETLIPEINQRDNFKKLNGINNKPFQFWLFKDFENPHYNQVFFMPIAEYNNIYDGLTLGIKVYNKAHLRKPFNYRVSPQYAIKSKSLTGSASIYYIQYLENQNLHNISYGFYGNYSAYAENLFVQKITPSLTFQFRDYTNLRSNKRHAIQFKYIDIHRDKDPNNNFNSKEPNYNVFDARYIYSNANLINYNSWYTDFQLGKTFSKLILEYEYRHLFQNNHQLNLRFYGGAFLKNKTDKNSDYFSFALDRPTDYLFELPYLGRSEDSGIFSQQYIESEGGFKSKLNPAFANQWITTFNASTTLWNYILIYGDAGFVKNKDLNPVFVYDAGLRFNLVTDYFEVYLPFYSNLGWEIAQPKYAEKIRVKFTIDPQVLLGLFRRRWF